MRRNLFAILFITSLCLFTSPPSFADLIINRRETEHRPSSSLMRMSGSPEKYTGPRDAAMTCDRFPRVCRSGGSPGPDCCRKRCVDVMADGVNCGECGRKCGYGEKCCGGSCVNVMYDRSNCGGCRRRCAKGSSCRYGMCGYA